MKAGDDPRTDQHPNDGTPGGFPEVGKSKPVPAPGGAGTGTRHDPASEPPPEPGHSPSTPPSTTPSE